MHLLRFLELVEALTALRASLGGVLKTVPFLPERSVSGSPQAVIYPCRKASIAWGYGMWTEPARFMRLKEVSSTLSMFVLNSPPLVSTLPFRLLRLSWPICRSRIRLAYVAETARKAGQRSVGYFVFCVSASPSERPICFMSSATFRALFWVGCWILWGAFASRDRSWSLWFLPPFRRDRFVINPPTFSLG